MKNVIVLYGKLTIYLVRRNALMPAALCATGLQLDQFQVNRKPVARESQVARLAIKAAAHYATGLQLDQLQVNRKPVARESQVARLAIKAAAHYAMVELQASCKPVAYIRTLS
jgi:hypothetical protein